MWGTREKMLVDRLEPVAASMGLTIIELELPHNTGGFLRIFLDGRDGRSVTVDDCARFSPVASSFLETQEGFDFRYHLEVSSPGLERPIRRWEEVPRFIGTRVTVMLTEKVEGRKKIIGTLTACDTARDSFTILAEDGATVVVPRGMVKRMHVIWEGDK